MRLRRRPAQRFVRLIHRRQQFDIRARVTLRKPMTTIAALLHLPVLAEPPHQPVHLRTTQTRHLDQVPQQQPAHGFRLFLVLLRPQGPFYPAVNLFPVQRPKANSSLAAKNRSICSIVSVSARCIVTFTDPQCRPSLLRHPFQGFSIILR
jgi:hypothetical protein